MRVVTMWAARTMTHARVGRFVARNAERSSPQRVDGDPGRYERRKSLRGDSRYSMLNPAVYVAEQEEGTRLDPLDQDVRSESGRGPGARDRVRARWESL